MDQLIIISQDSKSCEIFTTTPKYTEPIPPVFHKLLWLFPVFQELSPAMMRSANSSSGENIFSFLGTPLLCPHGTLLSDVQAVGSPSITKDLLSTCSERHRNVQSSAGLRACEEKELAFLYN